MPKSIVKTKRGFTIIEVVLVLAIAGLIFMMVFIALPALQRSQRDTQRTNDMSRFMTQVTQYQSNNRGALPGTGEGQLGVSYNDNGEVTADTIVTGGDSGKWKNFYVGYLLAGGDTFEDPGGAPYQLSIAKCMEGKSSAGTVCRNQVQRVSENGTYAEFEDGYQEGEVGNSTSQNYTISVVLNATCNGEQAVYSAGSRKVAIVYKKEGGGVICESN